VWHVTKKFEREVKLGAKKKFIGRREAKKKEKKNIRAK